MTIIQLSLESSDGLGVYHASLMLWVKQSLAKLPNAKMVSFFSVPAKVGQWGNSVPGSQAHILDGERQ